jgi:hypothetical protein
VTLMINLHMSLIPMETLTDVDKLRAALLGAKQGVAEWALLSSAPATLGPVVQKTILEFVSTVDVTTTEGTTYLGLLIDCYGDSCWQLRVAFDHPEIVRAGHYECVHNAIAFGFRPDSEDLKLARMYSLSNVEELLDQFHD